MTSHRPFWTISSALYQLRWEPSERRTSAADYLTSRILDGSDLEVRDIASKMLDLVNDLTSEPAQYLVTWTIDAFDAANPVAAARQARAAQIRPGTTATVFDVLNTATRETTRVDLSETAECPDHGGYPHRHDSDGNPSY